MSGISKYARRRKADSYRSDRGMGIKGELRYEKLRGEEKPIGGSTLLALEETLKKIQPKPCS